MRTIGSGAALIIVLFTTSLFRDPASPPGKSPVDDIKPYPRSREFCTEHITGAPEGGKPGAHIGWTAYHSVDPPEKVVLHYTKILGSENHQKERSEDVWRFPLAKPNRVLRVMQPGGTFPLGQCPPPPESARTIVIISTVARAD